MIIDTSAMIAIIAGEDGADALLEAIATADRPRMSAASYLECGIVLDRRAPAATRRRLDTLLEVLSIEVVAVTPTQAVVARQAHRDFGRGSGSRARLNFGDCLTYALAAELGEALLFVGDDFGHTDLRPALSSA